MTDEIEIKKRDKAKGQKRKGGTKHRARKASAAGAKAKSQPKRQPAEGGDVGEGSAPDPNLTSRTDVNE
ncbi:MAG: hypothetical protein H0X73_12995 [Chthoniobacterales bacterium]|nr:hypothetical protein [Chthoniobacterales bacterium]